MMSTFAQFDHEALPGHKPTSIITLTKQTEHLVDGPSPDLGAGAPEIEVTQEMIEAGAKVLGDYLWECDPFAKQVPAIVLKDVVPRLYRAMAALAGRK